MNLSVMNRPFCIQLELVFGCNLRCKMCGINSLHIAPGNYRYMKLEHLIHICREINRMWPRIRIEFAMCGEPTLHPQIDIMLRTARDLMPHAQILLTSNGLTLSQDWSGWEQRLWDAGVNIVAIDLYQPYGPRIKSLFTSCRQYPVADYYGGEFNQHHYHGPVAQQVVLIDDVIRTSSARRQRILFNHAGNSALTPPLAKPMNKMCTFPFREMVVRYNGVVNICCLDFGSELDVGNVLDTPIETLWESPVFTAIRRYLYAKQRPMSPCCFCDAPSGMRPGIIPHMKRPSDDDQSIISHAQERSQHLHNRPSAWVPYSPEGFGL